MIHDVRCDPERDEAVVRRCDLCGEYESADDVMEVLEYAVAKGFVRKVRWGDENGKVVSRYQVVVKDA